MTIYKIWITGTTSGILHNANNSCGITSNGRPMLHNPLWIKRVINSNGKEEITNCCAHEASEFYRKVDALSAIYRFKLLKESDHLIMDAVKFTLTMAPKRKNKSKAIRKLEGEMRRLDIEL